MEGFSRVPSSITLFSSKYLYTVEMNRFWWTAVTAWVWSPSMSTSGSTIGTRPVSWHMRAYLANPHAASFMARADGNPFASSILMAVLHLANLAPCAYAFEQRSSSPSKPEHHCSPSAPQRGLRPVSTLIPGTIPCSSKTETIDFPDGASW